jgi:hypothetical protein
MHMAYCPTDNQEQQEPARDDVTGAGSEYPAESVLNCAVLLASCGIFKNILLTFGGGCKWVEGVQAIMGMYAADTPEDRLSACGWGYIAGFLKSRTATECELGFESHTIRHLYHSPPLHLYYLSRIPL